MQNVLKQFVEKVTELRRNQFYLTRLRLTAIYAVLLLIILFISSVITHSLFSSRLEYRFRGRPFLPPPQIVQIEGDFRNQVREELVMSLFLVNGVLFFGAVGLSYVLAGVTLLPIQEAYERQRRFLSDASHELRTPLAILQTDLENELGNSKIGKQEKENVRSHLEEVERMGAIVKDLLLISRLDGSENVHAIKESVDLLEIVGASVVRLQGYANKQSVTLSLSAVHGQVPIIVHAHKEHVLQAICNLIKNGIDYNKKDGSVVVSLTHDQKEAIVTVSDTGIGISQDDIPKLFDRFYRVDQSRTREIGGSGLGLSIVQSVAHTYGGTVSVESVPEIGTKVALSLPLHI